jgi:hypothetical protein
MLLSVESNSGGGTGVELRPHTVQMAFYHLNNSPHHFCFSYFSDRFWCFLLFSSLVPASDGASPTYAFNLAGTLDARPHDWLIG